MRPHLFIWMLPMATIAMAQPTYYQDIEPVISKNCTSCHKPGGIGPFSLQTYEEVSSKGNFISYVTKTRYMPPWFADPSFQTFRNEKNLSDDEIALIQAWVDGGLLKGKKTKAKRSIGRDINIEPDLSLPMLNPYQIADKGEEDFRYFVIPTNQLKDEYIAAVEFIPGNRRQVHHSRIMVDTTQLIRGIDGMSELDPDVRKFQNTPLVDEFLYGWVPGNTKIFFPPGSGKKLFKGSDLILNIHYSPSSKIQEDKSVINLYFSKLPVSREVHTLTLRENDILNQPFFIEAERMPTFKIQYYINRDISLISVLPHMHFLGKSFLSYAITPWNETIPLIKIDKWDFNWQTTYQFKNLLKIPAGSRIYVEAKYDNTTENPANPNQPARDVGYGWNSTDEMCNMVIYYLDYQEGDENLKY